MSAPSMERRFEYVFDRPAMRDIDEAWKDGAVNDWERQFLHDVRRAWLCRGIIPSPRQERCLYGLAAKLDARWSRASAPAGDRRATPVESAVFGMVREGGR